MAVATKEEILDAIGDMSVLELSELLKEFEDRFDVTAAAPVAVAAAGAADGGAEAEEKSNFDVVLAEIGGEKIKVVKAVKDLAGLGLKEAKDLVESAPATILEAAEKDAAEEAKAKLEESGATVELK